MAHFDPTFSQSPVATKCTSASPTTSNNAMYEKAQLVPSDLLKYLKSIEENLKALLKDGSPSETTDIILNKTINELLTLPQCVALGLCAHYEGSRIIEFLVTSFPALAARLLFLFMKDLSNEDCLLVVSDKISSHVVQSLICQMRQTIQENISDDEMVANVFSIFSSLGTIFSGNINKLIFDSYACHVVRSFLVTICGKPLFYEEIIKEHEKNSSSLEYSVPSSFRVILENFLATSFANIFEKSTSIFDTVASHQTASPILQMFFIIEREFKDELDLSKKHSFIGLMGTDKLKDEGAFLSLCTDRIASRLVEMFFYASFQVNLKLVKKICRSSFFPLMTVLVKNDIGNYAAQSFFKFCTDKKLFKESLDTIDDTLASQLIELNKFGIIYHIVSCSVRLRAYQSRAMEMCSSSLLSGDENICEKLMFLNSNSSRRSFQVLGCCTLSLIFEMEHPSQCGKFVQCFLSLSVLQLHAMARNSFGSRTIESFFQSSAIPSGCKLKLSRKFVSASLVHGESAVKDDSQDFHLSTLAIDKIGSHVIDAMFKASDINVKILINEQLAEKKTTMQESKFGRLVMRNCFLYEFMSSRPNWEQKMQMHQDKNEKKTLLLQEFLGSQDGAKPLPKRPRQNKFQGTSEAAHQFP